LRAKVVVAVQTALLVVVVGVGAAKQEPRENPTTEEASAPTELASPTSSTTTTMPSVPPPAPPSAPAITGPPAPATPKGPGVASLAQLRITDEGSSPPGYSRDLFPSWLDLDGNGCDAREDTLIAESLVIATVSSSGCEV
jgi:hypothetical protein